METTLTKAQKEVLKEALRVLTVDAMLRENLIAALCLEGEEAVITADFNDAIFKLQAAL